MTEFCPSIMKMWILLEGLPSPLKLGADVTKVSDLNDFKGILSSKFKELKGVRLHNIIFWGNDNIPIRPGTEFQSLAEETTDENRSKRNVYFVNYGTEIWNAYNFNTIVKSQTAQEDNNVVLKLKVLIKGQKKYSDWNLKAVFKDILRRQTYGSLADMQKFYMKEYAPLDPPFTGEELKDFVT
ncbi:hypothetical protein RhiirC2_783725 [Rhizophagus irregularis]|uniref:Uncharacterized protein n=1 Tax=Rhizophagus irregularis TaxID=588596 RepID=A0A2N1N0B2_9GLOM|nr:hypothetical protein RhiirC2_783725 [Rhizophagus irregularis]